MNKKSLLWLTPMILLLVGRAWAEDLPWEMKLPFKEATIQYELTGSDKGTETLYVQEYGKRQARTHASVMSMMGTTQKTDTVQITDPDWIYTYDLVGKKGTKTTNPTKLYREEYNKLSAEGKKNFEKNAKELGSGMLGQFGAKVKQKGAKVLGYDCDVTTVGGMSTVYILHGSNIPLRSETTVMGMNNVLNATKIDTAAPVPDKVLAPPAGIEPMLDQQTDLMMTRMVKDTVATLAKPDGAKVMQQAGPMGMMGGANMQQQLQDSMKEQGLSPEQQQEAMRQLNEAMQQMQKAKQPTK
ncbi:MAG: hypothetical protein LBD10_13645 [Desulfobulbus sp.]|jgi:hypothetical protein|uniref:hypothetical protein n=1 Tax=Desulfobulbus sp. TaxID=895 RepID=UPI00283EC7D3|nr:hypothetical protein [Desulfobulbus sp.]MDR2551233.1 hypothetical protein [Desulfobulbus sp.]